MSMQTKRDQLRAYLFIVNRVKAALLRANPDGAAIPFRRITSATIVGLLLTLIIGGVFALIGVISPGSNKSWRESAVVLADDTGTVFAYDQAGDVLYPVVNHASAMLLGGASMASVSEKSLAGVRRGMPIGIAGAPDDLPAAADLSSSPPVACARPADANAPADVRSTLLLMIGQQLALQPLEDKAVLVAAPDGSSHLVWRGQRFAVPGRDVRTSLGLTGIEPVPVPAAWLNTLTARTALRPPELPRYGQPPESAVSAEGARVGQVLVAEMPNGARRYHLVTDDGLVPVTELVAQLMLGQQRAAEAYPGAIAQPRPVGPAVLSSAPVSEPPPGLSRTWPDRMPELAPTDPEQTALCSVAGAGGPAVTRTIISALPAAASDDTATVVRPGSGLLTRAAGAPGVASGGLYLITDLGLRYPVPSAKAATLLGYPEGTDPVPVSSALLEQIPEGPALDPAAARTPQPPLDRGGP